MKATVVLTAGVILSASTVVKADECHNICADVKKGISYKAGCSPFRNSLPKPKVGRLLLHRPAHRGIMTTSHFCGVVLLTVGLELG